MTVDLYDVSLFAVFLAGIVVICAVIEAGWQLGARGNGWGGSHIFTLESAMLGLLALMVGFTFAMALTRFETRREAILKEANAIGTTALRARLLPEPHRTETLKLLREYVRVRIDYIKSSHSQAERTASIARSNALQEQLWQQTMAVAAKDKAAVPTGLFIQTLNEMIDSQGVRLAAFRNRVPDIVPVALFLMAMVAGGFAGYASALEARRSRVPAYLVGLLVTGVIYIILDLDRPYSGFITIDQQPMIDAAASINSFPDQ